MKSWLLAVMLYCLAGDSSANLQADDSTFTATAVVNSENNALQDQVIASRMQAIAEAISGMEAIEITVQAGVLTLHGEVTSMQMRNEAVAIANGLPGVVYVQNQLQEPLAVRSRLAPAADKFRDMLSTSLQMLPLLLVAVLAIASFALLGSWVSQRGSWLRRIGLTELASNLGMRFVRLFITGIGILIALELLDATALVSAVLGVAGVIGIALGFAFRNIVENYLAGVLLSTRNPFAIGDQIQLGNLQGNVVRLTSRDTVLMTAEGNHLRIPNSHIITSAMTNFSRNPLRRFEFNVGVATGLDLVQVRQVGVATLQSMTGILTEPRPRVLVAELGDSTVLLRCLAWIDQRETDFLKARSEAIRQVKTAFDAAGVDMPVPTYQLHVAESATATAATQSVVSPVAGAVLVEDVSADTTIEQQMAAELNSSSEENLLPGGDVSGRQR